MKLYGTELRTIEFETDEVTAMNIDVSPDGKEIAFDLLGDIYTLPIEGGEATPLTTGRSWDTGPQYAPDGARIAFVSDRGAGIDGLWLANRKSKHLTLLTDNDTLRTGVSQLETPAWSSDGRAIAVRWGLVRIAIVDARSGVVQVLSTAGAGTAPARRYARGGRDSYHPSFTPDGRYVYLHQSELKYPIGRIIRVDRETGKRVVITENDDTTQIVHDYAPVVSRTGRWMLYARYHADRSTTLRLRDLASGDDRELMPFPNGDDPRRWSDYEGPRRAWAFLPGDSAVVLAMNGKLWRVLLSNGTLQAIPFRAMVSQEVIPPVRPRPRRIYDGPVAIRAIRAPAISPDGKTLVFTAVGRLWVQDLATKRLRRLTASEDGEYNAAISPDSRWVAFLGYRDLDQRTRSDITTSSPMMEGRIMLAPLSAESGTPVSPRALTSQAGEYGAPAWVPDGRRIVFTTKNPKPRDRASGTLFVWTDTSGAPAKEIGAGPWDGGIGPVNSRRGYAVSADGTRLYFAEFAYVPQRGTSIVSMRLDGSDRQLHLRLRGEYTVAAIAPTGRHAVVAHRGGGGAYLADVSSVDAPPLTDALADSALRRITTDPISSALWLNDSIAIYALGASFSRFDLRNGRHTAFHAVDLSLSRARPTKSFAIRGARLVTMAGERGQERVIERGTLVVRNGRIAAIDAMERVAIPEDATIIDGAGYTITPGLIDVHLHIGVQLEPRPTLDPDDISALAYGVTTRYDPSTLSAEGNLEHHEMIETGATAGPRHYYSGPTLQTGVPTLDAARNILAEYDAFDVAMIKEYEQDTRRERQYLARAAAERGVGITGHVGGLREALTRAADGFTAIEHLRFTAPIYRDVATFLARSGVNFTVNIITGGGIDVDPQGYGFFFREMLRASPDDTLKYYRYRWPDYFRQRMGDVYQPQRYSFEQLRLGRSARAATAIIREGGTVSIGAHNPPGLFAQWEMQVLQRGGATPAQVLRAATINGAKKLGIDGDVGSLQVGKLADFLVLTANPLDDIRNATKIRYVVADATIYDGETMTRLWPTYQPLSRMGWQTPEEYAKLRHAPPLTVTRLPVRARSRARR